MKMRNTWILLGVLLVLGLFVYFYEIEGGKKRDEQEKAEKKLFQVEEAKVQEISLLAGGQEIVGRRDGTQWKIVKPLETEADETEWGNMARTLGEMSREQAAISAGAAEMKNFGLESPRAKVSFKTSDSKEGALEFGDDNPQQTLVYARKPGSSEVLLLSSSYFRGYEKKLFDLRQKTVLKASQEEVQEFTLRNPSGTINVQKKGEEWEIRSPIQAKADKSEISSFLSGFSYSQVKELIDEPAADAMAGLQSPAYELTLVVGKDRALKKLQIGAMKAAGTPPATPADETAKGQDKASKGKEAPSFADLPADATFYARDDSRKAVLVVDKPVVEKLNKALTDFRDKTILTLDRSKLKEIEIQGGGEKIHLAKEGESDWVAAADKSKKAKSEQVAALLSAIEYGRAKKLIDPPFSKADLGLEPPAVQLALIQDGKRLEMALGKEGDEGVYALVAGETAVKVLEKEVLEKSRLKSADLFASPSPPTTLKTQ